MTVIISRQGIERTMLTVLHGGVSTEEIPCSSPTLVSYMLLDGHHLLCWTMLLKDPLKTDESGGHVSAKDTFESLSPIKIIVLHLSRED